MKQNTMVPYESIDSTGARALRPGVSFFVSAKTITEVIVEKDLSPSSASMAAKASSPSDYKISKRDAEHICALADSETAQADFEHAIALLQTADGHRLFDVYRRIGEVLRSYGLPDVSPNFIASLATRLNMEPTSSPYPPMTDKAQSTVAASPLLEQTSSIFPAPRQRES